MLRFFFIADLQGRIEGGNERFWLSGFGQVAFLTPARHDPQFDDEHSCPRPAFDFRLSAPISSSLQAAWAYPY